MSNAQNHPLLSSSAPFTHFPSSSLGWGSRDHKPPNEPRSCGILKASDPNTGHSGTKCLAIPSKKTGDGCSSLSFFPQTLLELPQQSTNRWEMPFLEEITPRASHGKEEHEEGGWEYFPLWWENTQPAPFPPFFPILQQNRKTCWQSFSSPWKSQAQLPNSVLQKTPVRLRDLGNVRIIVRNPIFLLKRKG